MPLSNRRRARRKEIQLQETSDAEAPDSSPTRPSNKKRKVRSTPKICTHAFFSVLFPTRIFFFFFLFYLLYSVFFYLIDC